MPIRICDYIIIFIYLTRGHIIYQNKEAYSVILFGEGESGLLMVLIGHFNKKKLEIGKLRHDYLI